MSTLRNREGRTTDRRSTLACRPLRRHAGHLVKLSAPLTLAALLLPLLAPVPALGDNVYLTNGRVFEDVLARVEGDRVAIRLPHGLIRIPAAKVSRIVEQDTPLATFLRRKADLASQPDGGAASDWIDLARWVRDRDLASAYREAATTAASRDPRAEGLEPLMRELGLLFDEGIERWVTEGELMRRRGFVPYDGAWVTPSERAESERRIAEAHTRRIEAQRTRQRDRALADMASALRTEAETRARESSPHRTARHGIPLGHVYYWPGVWVPPQGHRGRTAGDGSRGDGADGDANPGHRSPGAQRGRRNTGTFRASDWIPGRLNPRAAAPPGSLISRSSSSSSTQR